MFFHNIGRHLPFPRNNPRRRRLGRASYESGDWAFYAIAILGGVTVFWLTFR
jgi:hypothetical protein